MKISKILIVTLLFTLVLVVLAACAPESYSTSSTSTNSKIFSESFGVWNRLVDKEYGYVCYNYYDNSSTECFKIEE